MPEVRLVSARGRAYTVNLPGTTDKIRDAWFFAYHKSGSTLMNNLIGQYAAFCDVPCFSLYDAAFNEGISTADIDPDARACFRDSARLYTGFRHYPKFDLELRDAPLFLLVRDPRDMLVSMYYSELKSHVVPKDNPEFRLQRAAAEAVSIDQFVIRKHGLYLKNFRVYRKRLPPDTLTVYRYEDVIYRKQAWLEDMVEKAGLPNKPGLIRKVVSQFDIIPEAENPDQHIRQVHPGNHKRKLKPATIRFLNERLAEFLDYYDYR